MPLKSLAEIRGGGSNDSPSSSGGLKSLQDVRMQQQQQSLMKDYPQMVADEQNYGYSDSPQNQENAQYADLMKQAYQSNPQAFTDKNPQPSMLEQLGNLFSPSTVEQGLNIVGSKMADDLVSAPQTLNYPFAKIAEYAVPDAPLIGQRPDGSYGNLEGTNARQAFTQANPVAPTGDPIWDKASDFIGQNVGPLVGTYGTGLGSIPGMVDNALTNAGVQLGGIGRGIVTGAISGAPMNAAATLATTDPSITDLANSANQGILLGGALGGLGEAVLGGLGTGSKLGKLSDSQIKGSDLSTNEHIPNESAQPAGNLNTINENPSTGLSSLSDIRSSVRSDFTPEGNASFLNQLDHYHGTPSEINLSDIGGGSDASVMGKGLYIADNPNVAENYAKLRGQDNGIVYGVKTNFNKALDLDSTAPPELREIVLNASGDKRAEVENALKYKPNITSRQLIEYSSISDPGKMSDIRKGLVANGYDSMFYRRGEGPDAYHETIVINPKSVQMNHINKAKLQSLGDIRGAESEAAAAKSSAENISPAKEPELIKLTPAEIARNERITKFSQTTDNLGELPNTASQIQSKTGREPISIPQIANEAYIKGVDNLHRVNQFDQAARSANGGELNPSDSAYMLGLNARGNDMQASQIINKNLINSRGEAIGQSLADVTHQIPKGKEAAFNDYVVAKHAIERMGRGEKVYRDDLNMTIQKAKAIVDQYDKSDPSFKDIAKQYTKFSRDFGQAWYVDTGLFKKSQWDAATESNPNYVSNQRVLSKLEKQQQFNSKGGIVNQSSPVKKAEGSQRPIVSPIESSIENVAKGVKTAKMNEAGQAVVRSLRRNPEELKGFAEIVHDQPKMDVEKMLREEGPDSVIDHIHDSFEVATRKPDLTKGNVVTVLEHGEPVHIRIHDPQFLEAISNLSPKGQDYVTALVGKGTKVMKNLTTGVNPIFGLTRNIFRDIPHSFISSKTTINPLRFGFDFLHGAVSVLADSASHSGIAKKLPDSVQHMLHSLGKLYNDYKDMGGGHSSPTASDRNLLAQAKEKILPSDGLGQKLKRNLITRPYHALENLNNAAEAAPRLGEFKRVVKQGGGDYNSRVKGLYEANDLTVNFNKYGNVTKNADAYLPYLNAAVQGLDQLVRMGTQGGPKRLAQVYGKAISVITIPSVLTYLLYHDDPDYQKISNFTKDNYLLIKNSDGTFTKIAKPKELGMIFGTSVERALRAWQDQDPRAFQDFAHNFLQNMLPPGVGGAVTGAMGGGGITGSLTGIAGDTLFGPIASLGANKDFAGRPIVPGDLKGLSPALQYDVNTSEPAKLIGGLTNTSPKQLDYLAKSYGGVLGQIGIPALTNGKGSDPLSRIGNVLQQQVSVDPAYSNDISRNFYDAKAQYDQAKADEKSQGRVSNTIGVDMFLNKIAGAVSQIRKQMNTIQNNSNMDDATKQDKLKAMQIQMNNMQQQALTQLQKVPK